MATSLRGDLVNALWAIRSATQNRPLKQLVLTEHNFNLMPVGSSEQRPVLKLVNGEAPLGNAGMLVLAHLGISFPDLNDWRALVRMVVDSLLGATRGAPSRKVGWPLFQWRAQHVPEVGVDHWTYRALAWDVADVNIVDATTSNLLEAYRSRWTQPIATNGGLFSLGDLSRAVHAWAQHGDYIGAIPTYHTANDNWGVMRIHRRLVEEIYSADHPRIDRVIREKMPSQEIVGCEALSRVREWINPVLPDGVASIYIGEHVPGHGRRCWLIPESSVVVLDMSPQAMQIGHYRHEGLLAQKTEDAFVHPYVLQLPFFPYWPVLPPEELPEPNYGNSTAEPGTREGEQILSGLGLDEEASR